MNKRLTKTLKSLVVTTATLFFCGGHAQIGFGESAGRIEERVTARWLPPQQEDYDDFIMLLDRLTPKPPAQKSGTTDTLASVKKLLNQSNVNPATRAGLMLKLAELYIQNARAERQQTIKRYRLKYDAWLESEQPQADEEPQLDLEASETYFRNAIQTYRDLFNEFPKFNADPALIYEMANLQLNVNNANAKLYFEKLLKESPKSVNNWVPKAYLGLGEYHFAKKEYSVAMQYYQRAAQSNLSGIAHYAQYKTAWAQTLTGFAQGPNAAAADTPLKTFRKLGLNSQVGSEAYRKSQAANWLKNQVINDLVWIWSETKDLSAATAFFLNVGNQPKAYLDTVERIGWKYEQENNAKMAGEYYHLLFKKAPERLTHVRLHIRLIELFHKNNMPLAVLNEVQDLAQTLTNKSGGWYQKHHSNTQYIKFLNARVHKLLLEKSTIYHKQYLASKDVSFLKVTNVLYAIYLFLYPNSPQAYDIRFNFATTLELLGRLEEAVTQYHLVVKAKKSLSEHRDVAAEKMITLQLRLVNSQKFPPVPRAGTIKAPLEIPKQKKILVSVIDTYLIYFPANKQSTALRYNAAKSFFDYGHYQTAMTRFQDLVRRDPSSNESKTAVQIVLSYFEFHRDWGNLVGWSEKFLKFEQALGPEIAALALNKLTLGMWQIAITYQKAKKFDKAAVAFIAFQNRLPRDKNADNALFQAMMLYYQLGDGNNGIAVGKKLITTYPESVYGANAMFSMAIAYQSLNKYNDAAQTFESFVVKYPKEKRAPNALYQTANIYKGLNNLDRSAFILESLATRYPTNPIAPTALLENAEIHLKLDQFNKAAAAYNAYVQRYSAVNAELTLYAMVQTVVTTTPSVPASLKNPTIMNVENQLKSKPRNYARKAREAIGTFYFEIAEALISEFTHQKVAYYDFNEYESSIANYLSHVKNIEYYFGRLVGIVTLEGLTEAYYKLGQVYELALGSFQEKWNMDGLRPEEVKNILNAKERVTLSLREKMENAYKTSFEMAKQNKVFTKYRNLALDKISKLRPGQYKQMKEEYNAPAPASGQAGGKK